MFHQSSSVLRRCKYDSLVAILNAITAHLIFMIFLDGPSNSSDDEIIIEELNVEIGKGLQEEARGLEVTREELSDASKVDEKWKRNSKEKLMDESTEMGPSFAPPQIQVHDHLQTSGRVGVSGELQRFEEMIQIKIFVKLIQDY